MKSTKSGRDFGIALAIDFVWVGWIGTAMSRYVEAGGPGGFRGHARRHWAGLPGMGGYGFGYLLTDLFAHSFPANTPAYSWGFPSRFTLAAISTFVHFVYMAGLAVTGSG